MKTVQNPRNQDYRPPKRSCRLNDAVHAAQKQLGRREFS